ncbi:MAG: FkbM family methyltransferase, partial [Bryobacteraceae bacterium]
MKSFRLWTVVALLLIAAAVVLFYPPARLSALALAGRSPNCPFSQAVKSHANLQDQIDTKDRILAASKLIETDEQGFEHWQTPRGRYWIPGESRYSLHFNLAEMERRIYGTGPQAVQPGDIVLDCGANVGTFTRQALNDGAELVVAIEPAPENLECLRRAFAPEIASGRVLVYPKGVWHKDDFLPMYIHPENSPADSFLMHNEHSELSAKKIPLTTIDKLVAELQLPRVDYIKMDIEGAEPNALEGARQTLSKYHPRVSVAVYHA